MNYYGELLSVLTAFCWTFNSVVFTNAGKRVNSFTVNRTRLFLAFISLIPINFIFTGFLFPINLNFNNYLYLSLSGITGFLIGDTFLFESFVLIGPRIAMLIMTTSPILSTILAFIFLNENISLLSIIAILITLMGIGWVIMEKRDKNNHPIKKDYIKGIIFASIGSLGQAVGLLLSKFGLEGNISTISANFIRITSAVLVYFIYSILSDTLKSDIRKLMKNTKAFWEIFSGSLTGPVLGVILSLEAINHTKIGIASTLMSLSPIILIPVSHFLYKEKITIRSVIGTIIAIAGASWLFLLK